MSDTAALASLHTSLIDAEKGYETAIADAGAVDTRPIFERMAALHRRAHSDVHSLLLDSGERPDEGGSFMSLVHKTVISVRSAVAGLDRSSLSSFADGEQHIVESYDKAIAGADPAQAQKLRTHREALVGAIAEMRAKAA